MAELAIDDAERVLYLGADAGFDALDLIGLRIHGGGLVQKLAQARAHGQIPLHIDYGVWPLVRTLVPCVGQDICRLPVQQAVGLDHVVDVALCAAHGVHQTGIGVHADVSLHAEGFVSR